MRLASRIHRIGTDVNSYLIEDFSGSRLWMLACPAKCMSWSGSIIHTLHVPAVDALFVGDALTSGNVLLGSAGRDPRPLRSIHRARWRRFPNWRPYPPTGSCLDTERLGGTGSQRQSGWFDR
jgi:hypothetical protein